MKFNSILQLLCISVVTLVLVQSDLVAQSLQLNWNENGTQCLYIDKGNETRTYYRVDVLAGEKSKAFDHGLIAKTLSEELKEKIDQHKLPFTRIEFVSSKKQNEERNLQEKILLSAPQGAWQLDPRSGELSKIDANQFDAELFMPIRPSVNGNERTDITIVNQLEGEIELFWVNSRRGLTSYGKVAPSKSLPMSTYIGHVWLVKDAAGKSLACFAATEGARIEISKQAIAAIKTKQSRREKRNKREIDAAQNPWEAFVDEHDLWLKPKKGGASADPILLAGDGTKKNSFSRLPGTTDSGRGEIRWNAGFKNLLAVQRTWFEKRKVFYVESSPTDQLQPKLREYTYPKPGDPVEVKTFRLFSMEDQKEIPISNELFPTPYATHFVRWSDSGDRFWVHYNERGHKVIRLLEISVADGSVTTIAENTSETFLEHTSRAKTFYEFLDDEQLLWASQRSGWNHLYRIDMKTRSVINAVTAGEWNIKRIEKIDHKEKKVWFYAVGVIADQDPYHEHFCRVDFDGRNFKVLTEGDGTHSVTFERDREYFVDTWSRVDLAPVVELRKSDSGELVSELSRRDTSASFSDRRLPERFSAPGRDGKTEIWGILHFPKDFDSNKTYPVVENIYAGPHDHHVPKRFRDRYPTQHKIADAGIIVVQIDGMGTAWRSKAFHDVCYKNLKDAGFPDRIAWMKSAAKKFPQMDLSRVGIYGGSAGGQNAMAALLWHNDFYSVAVADCGCHDNRMDKMWWNEQWMGFPIDESYQENSNMENAHLLQGHLMLTVGEKDRNVDPASTTQVVRALIKADKDFEFVLVPGGGHGIGESRWAAKKRLEFLKRHLRVDQPADKR